MQTYPQMIGFRASASTVGSRKMWSMTMMFLTLKKEKTIIPRYEEDEEEKKIICELIAARIELYYITISKRY